MVNILLSKYNFHEEWARDAISKYFNANDKVVVVPFAFREKLISNSEEWQDAYSKSYGKYYSEVVEPFVTLGISEDSITWLNYFEHTDDEMKRLIKSSNIVFFTGGLPDMAVQRFLDRNLISSLDASKTIIGASAGALMQLSNYFISPDEDYPEFIYSKGLGLIRDNFYIEVHFEDNEVQNNCIQQVLREKTDIVYGIKDTGGIIIDNGHLKLFGDVITFKK